MLNFKETASLVSALGKDVAVLVRGEMGIGKSSLPYEVQKDHPGHTVINFDCAARSEGDTALPWLVEINGVQVTTLAPSELLGLHLDAPCIINFDELPKASEALIQSVLPILLERRVGVKLLHPETIMMCTGNLATEMLGDSLLPHTLNRLCDVTMRKPLLVDEFGQPTEWLTDYAMPKKAPVSVIGFCLEYPQIFAEYKEGTKNNPYINHPGAVLGACVTPRSFSRLVFSLLPHRNRLSERVFYEGMAGMVGKACADSFLVYLNMEADLPTTAEVLADPVNTPVPASPISAMMMTYRIAESASTGNIGNLAVYIRRFSGELRALFTHLVNTRSGALIPHTVRLGLVADSAALRTA